MEIQSHSEIIKQIMESVLIKLGKDLDLTYNEILLLINSERDSLDLNLVSRVKTIFSKNITCNKDLITIFSLSEENYTLLEINQFLINKYLRLIVRKEFKLFEKVKSLTLFFKTQGNSKEVFVFFFIICKYLNIKKIKIDLIKPKNNKDLSIFLIFFYILTNKSLDKITINSYIDFNFEEFKLGSHLQILSIFDIVSLKSNLKDLSINIKNYSLKLSDFSKTLKNLNLKRLILNDLFEVITQSDEDWENFISILSSQNNLKKFVFNYTYKFNFFRKITFTHKTLLSILDLYCKKHFKYFEISDINHMITQDFIDSISNNYLVLNKPNNFSHLNLILSFSNIKYFRFINFKSLIELNIGPVDIPSFNTITNNLLGCNFKTVTIRLKDENYEITLENYLNVFNFITYNSFRCDTFQILGYNFPDEVLVNLKHLIMINSSIKFIVISYFMEYIKPESNFKSEISDKYFYYAYDINIIFPLIFSLKCSETRLKKLKNKPSILRTISSFIVKRYPKYVNLINQNNIEIVINYNIFNENKNKNNTKYI